MVNSILPTVSSSLDTRAEHKIQVSFFLTATSKAPCQNSLALHRTGLVDCQLHEVSYFTCVLPMYAYYATAYLYQFAVLDFASQNLEEGGFARARGPQHETHASLQPISTALACTPTIKG